MRKTHDYTHEYRGIWRDGGRCRIEVYELGPGEPGRPAIVCSELADNDNSSVTNMAEYLAARLSPGTSRTCSTPLPTGARRSPGSSTTLPGAARAGSTIW